MPFTVRRTVHAAAAGVAALSLAATLGCAGDGGKRDSAPSPGAPPLLVDDAVAAGLLKPREHWTDDFSWSGRRPIRVLVPLSRTYYYVDRTEQAGLAFDALSEFSTTLRAKAPRLRVAPAIVIIPTRRERLLPDLLEGYGDMAIAGLAVTERRSEQVAFSLPTNRGIKDIIVTGPAAPKVASMDELSGESIYVRKSSSAYEMLEALNTKFVQSGKGPARLVQADELLEDEDLLQMVDAGIIPMTVVKDFAARMMAPVYDHLVLRSDLVVQDDVTTVVAMRKETMLLHQLVDDFVAGHSAGTTAFGDQVLQKNFSNPARLNNPTSEASLKRFRALSGLLQKYGTEYDLDWLLLAAQGFQESQLDTTGDKMLVTVKSLRADIDRYYAKEPMDQLNKVLFALASHDAGAEAVAGWRAKAVVAGHDPNLWFYNVEIVSAREAGRKTVDYVSRIYKYYAAYVLSSR